MRLNSSHPLYLKTKVRLLSLSHTAKGYLDAAFTIASLVCVSGLGCLVIVWAVSPAGEAHVTPKVQTVVVSRPGTMLKLSPGLKLSMASDQFVYKLRLVNAKEETVYVYPEVVYSDSAALEFGMLDIPVPASLTLGDYKLVADITYPRNPIKANTLQVQLARINVDTDLHKEGQ